jgi:iron complex outermembrane receptor protein
MALVDQMSISYSQPDNLNTSESYGLEFIGLSEILLWWTLSDGLTMFQIKVDGSNIGEEFVNSGFAWNTKITSDFKLLLDFSFQLVGNYESAEIEAQGRDLEQHSLDASVQKKSIYRKREYFPQCKGCFRHQEIRGQQPDQ